MNKEEYIMAFENIQYSQVLLQGIGKLNFEDYIKDTPLKYGSQTFYNPLLMVIHDLNDKNCLVDVQLKTVCNYLDNDFIDFDNLILWIGKRTRDNHIPVSKNEAQAIIQSLILLIRNNSLSSNCLFSARFLLPLMQEIIAPVEVIQN